MFWLTLYTNTSRLQTEMLPFEPEWSATFLRTSKQLLGCGLYASLSSTVNNTQCHITHITDKMSLNKPVQKDAGHFWRTAFFLTALIPKAKEIGMCNSRLSSTHKTVIKNMWSFTSTPTCISTKQFLRRGHVETRIQRLGKFSIYSIWRTRL